MGIREGYDMLEVIKSSDGEGNGYASVDNLYLSNIIRDDHEIEMVDDESYKEIAAHGDEGIIEQVICIW